MADIVHRRRSGICTELDLKEQGEHSTLSDTSPRWPSMTKLMIDSIMAPQSPMD